MAYSNQESKCSFGMYLDDPCHEHRLTRKVGMYTLHELTDETRKLLLWRTKATVINPNSATVCYHHEKMFGMHYQQMQRSCQDPWRNHRKKITKSLQIIDKDIATRLNLIPGQKLCSTCFSRAKTIEDEKDSGSDEYVPEEIVKETFDETLGSLECSPIKYVRARDRKFYAKRKLKQIETSTKSKLSKVLHMKPSILDEEAEKPIESEEEKCYQHMIEELKEKCKTSTRQEKIQILTLLPIGKTWSRERIMKEFEVSARMVNAVRALKRKEGILPIMRNKKSSKGISDEIKERVIEFFQNNEYTRECPGKKDYKSIKTPQGKVHKQKILLLTNIRELYTLYKNKYPNDKISKSKFFELRPKWCMGVGSKGSHNVCICEIHQNFKLLCESLPVKVELRELLGKIVCNTETRNCMINNCKTCPGLNELWDWLLTIFENNDYDMDDEVSFKQWLHTDHTQLVTMTKSVSNVVEDICESAKKLKVHHFIAKAQSKYLSDCKENLNDSTALVLVDFSENYSFIIQDAVQGHHWDNTQATLHPVVAIKKLN